MNQEGTPAEKTLVENETVLLDFKELRNTIYRNCRLVYEGGTPPILVNCDFVNCAFKLEGRALNTIHFLQMIANSTGGRDLVISQMLGLKM